MKYHYILPLAALAAAAAVPDDMIGHKQIVLQEQARHKSMWETLPGRKDMMSSVEGVVETIYHRLDNAMDAMARTGRGVVGSLLDDHERFEERHQRRRGSHRGRMSSGKSDQTVYELIRSSRCSHRFAKWIDEFPKIRDRLKDIKREYTVFVPTDEAICRFEDNERPSEKFMEKIIEYHVVPEAYSASRIINARTLPALLEEGELGHHHQRMRVSVGLFGIHLNWYCQIVASNIMGRNGIIHAVDNVLIPPPRQEKLIDAMPGKFSTFSLAMEKTGLGKDLHERDQRGGTIFAPTNIAWTKLGPHLNSFLFSEKGEKYLRVLLKYHVVENKTLYSDAYYDEEKRDSQRRGRRGLNKNVDENEKIERSRRRNRRRRHNGWSHHLDEDSLGNFFDDAEIEGGMRRSRRRHGRRRNGHHGRPVRYLNDDNEGYEPDSEGYQFDDVPEERSHRWHYEEGQEVEDNDSDLLKEQRRRRRDERRRRGRKGRRYEEDGDADISDLPEEQLHRRNERRHRQRGRGSESKVEDGDDNDKETSLELVDEESRGNRLSDDDLDDVLKTLYSRRRRHGRQHSRQDEHDIDDALEMAKFSKHWNLQLPTLLKERTIEVDISRWMGLVSMTVNSHIPVSMQDRIARDGVVQVVDSVLMPPRHGGRRGHDEDDDDDYENDHMSVDELKDRLKKFVEEDELEQEERRRRRGGRRHRNL